MPYHGRPSCTVSSASTRSGHDRSCPPTQGATIMKQRMPPDFGALNFDDGFKSFSVRMVCGMSACGLSTRLPILVRGWSNNQPATDAYRPRSPAFWLPYGSSLAGSMGAEPIWRYFRGGVPSCACRPIFLLGYECLVTCFLDSPRWTIRRDHVYEMLSISEVREYTASRLRVLMTSSKVPCRYERRSCSQADPSRSGTHHRLRG